MGAFAQVPLSFESPDPAKSYGQTLSLREAALNTQLRQQQIQSEQLKNQEAQLQLQDNTVLRNAWQQAQGDPRKLPSLVQGKVSPQTMMKLNQEVLTWQKGNLDVGEAQIKQNKERAERTSQIAGSITDENSLRNGLRMALQEKLIDSDTAQGLLTKGWTPDTQAQIEQYKQQGATYAQLHTAALDDVRSQVETGKLGEDRLKNAGTVLGAATSQADYAKAFYSDAVHPSVRGQFDAPEDFTEESSNKARRYGMTADQQLKAPAEAAKTQQEQLSYAGGRLSAAPTQAAYAGIYYSQPPDVRKNFADPKEWTPEIGKAQARIGLNAEQEVRAQQADERINMRRNQPNAQQEKEIISHLANIALQDSISGGGRRTGPEAYDDAVGNLRSYYKNNPDMQKYQEDVVDLLNKRKSTAGTADLKGDKLADEQSVRQLMYGNQGGQKKPAPAAAPAPGASGIAIPQFPPSQPNKEQFAYTNNNPGNLRFAKQEGATQGTGGYAKFESPDAGYAAIKQQITTDAGRGMSLDAYIAKYAPPSENDTKTYQAQARAALGVSGETPLSKVDPEKLAQFQAFKESSSTFGGKAATPAPAPAQAAPKKQEPVAPPQIVGNGMTVFYKGRYFPFAGQDQMDGFLKELGFSRTKK